MKKLLLLFGLICFLSIFVQCKKSELEVNDPCIVLDSEKDTCIIEKRTQNELLYSADLWVMSPGDKKYDVMKVYKNITGYPIERVKYFIEHCPALVGEYKIKDELLGDKRRLEEVGATCEIR